METIDGLLESEISENEMLCNWQDRFRHLFIDFIVIGLLVFLFQNFVSKMESALAFYILLMIGFIYYFISEAIFNIDKKSDEEVLKKNIPCSDTVIKILIEKIQKYKSQLLSSMGESDEYKELYTDFPHLKAPLQDSYNNAREINSKLHGRIKAIETLIELQRGTNLQNESS